jgi:hypothetical protein
MKKYEDRSDPLNKFLKEFTDEDADSFIFKHGFEKKFNNWCASNKFRTMSEVTIGKNMKLKGINQGLKQATWLDNGIQKRFPAWLGLGWKENDRDDRVERDTSTHLLRGGVNIGYPIKSINPILNREN